MYIYLLFFRKIDNRAVTMSRDDTKYHRLWSVATQKYLVLSVKNKNELSVTCKGTIYEYRTRESSKFQLFMLVNSLLSLVV